ncbi:50S ribosomal protein L33 [Siminovitchia sp. FSL H7-0308]|uniref:Large ribosomal subunit protein bL33 n=1 Tax=Siminovitchia thermophila TaxID=1245522 RepID=A0ABS2RB84_9BACI|nr:50S ribosomal protein L33 [Siminovitchia thermophila]MBM7716912.1 large subunit ribosomal protein L33 [Siminovitchia thermophila]ONK23417.1 50S ribosomal protein L33 [Bacillus sp. VT-16-64]
MKKKITLACTECGLRNYTTDNSKDGSDKRLTLKKHCRHCNAHTLHQETK